MKTLIYILALVLYSCISNAAFPQTYNGAFHELFFGIQPSARSEAMGRSISSIPGDPNSYFYNPACLAGLNGMNVNGGGNSTSKYNLFSDASFGYGAASWKFGKLGTLGLSVDVFNTGEYNLSYINERGDTVSGKFHNYVNNFRLTACLELFKDFYAGGNLNFFTPDENFGYLPLNKGNLGGPYLYLDLGILKSVRFGPKNFKQFLNFGASLMNVNSAGYKYSDGQGKGKLPVIMRIGSSYDLHIYQAFNLILNAEYEDILNSKNYEAIHTGIEFSLEPLLYLRAGYYNQDIPEKNTHSQFTYGIGVNILLLGYLSGIEYMPSFKLIFDYSHLNLPSFVKDINENNKSDLYSVTFTKWF